MMAVTNALLFAALVIVTVTAGWLLDRQARRHDAQLSRLLVHIQAPERAVQHATTTPTDGLLYLPPEDDKAWNEHHKVADN